MTGICEPVRYLYDCSNYYPRWDECAFLEVERVSCKHILKQSLHIIPTGNFVSQSTLSLENMTFFLLGSRCSVLYPFFFS